MAVGLPLKTTYANGDVYSASDVNDTNGTINLLTSSTLSVAAGKNRIINGGMDIWQRGTSFSLPNNIYTADRWLVSRDGTPVAWTVSQQSYTAGQTLTNSQYFLRSSVTTAGTTTIAEFTQKIEDVRTFAGQTVTVSFVAKADSARNVVVYFYQDFGTGGSSGVLITSQTVAITSTLTRYSKTFSIPSISGKTIGTSSSLYAIIQQSVVTGAVLEFGDVQIELGSTATTFSRAGGTIQGELAACQRYYVRWGGLANENVSLGIANSTTAVQFRTVLPVEMRVAPTSIDFSGLKAYDGVASYTLTTATFDVSGKKTVSSNHSTTGLTQYRAYALFIPVSTDYFGFSAEL